MAYLPSYHTTVHTVRYTVVRVRLRLFWYLDMGKKIQKDAAAQ